MNLNKFNTIYRKRKTVCHIQTKKSTRQDKFQLERDERLCRRMHLQEVYVSVPCGPDGMVATTNTYTKSFANGIGCLHYFAFIFILLVVFVENFQTGMQKPIQITMPACLPTHEL